MEGLQPARVGVPPVVERRHGSSPTISCSTSSSTRILRQRSTRRPSVRSSPTTSPATSPTGLCRQVSWIVAPNGHDEHPPSAPALGMWFTHQVSSALVSNPKIWAKTVLFILYDENDGFFDHVAPPDTTAGDAGRISDHRPAAGTGLRYRRTHRSRLPGPHARRLPLLPGRATSAPRPSTTPPSCASWRRASG